MRSVVYQSNNTMKRLFFIFFLLLNIYTSYGCSCSHREMTQKEYDKYSLIFIGEIIEVEDCDNKGYQKFIFEIEQIFKGQTTKSISGFNNCGGICNYSYKVGQKWLVYSNPEYGLINDQHACNPSIAIALKKNEVLIGTDYNISKQNWEFEIGFLQSRVTKDVKIVNFQFVKIVPLLKNSFILGIVMLFFLLCFKFRLRLLTYSIGLGLISGVFYYLLISTVFFPKFIEFKITHIFLVFGFVFISNFIYLTWKKEKLDFKKSFIFNYLIYLSMMITIIYMIFLNEHHKIELNTGFYKVLFIILGVGTFFSLFIATVFSLKEYFTIKNKKY